MNNKLPYQGMADQVASRGRYGDTTLMHVNPAEVQGLASLTPLTINPDTGYPEAFLPFVAPFLGTTLGTLLGGAAGATGLGLTAAGAAGSGIATGLATGSVEQGLYAGLTGFALGGALQGPNTPDFSGTVDDLTLGNQVGDLMGQGFTSDAALDQIGTNFAKKGIEVGTQAGTGTISDLGTSAGLKTFGKELIKPQNLLPFGTGLGGQAVQMDYEEFEKNNQAGIEAREQRKQDLRDNYVVKQPGMQGSVFNARNAPGNRTNAPNMNANQNPYNKFAREGGQVGYANGGQVKRMNPGGAIGAGITFDPITGKYVFPTGLGSTTGGTTEKTAEDIAPTKANMPDTRLFSQGYDPSSIDMATGLRKTDEQLEGMVRGRGLTPVPYNYMAGFMPEYQYVSNIQPTSTIGGQDSSNGVTINASGNGTGLPSVSYGTGQNVYKGSYDPDLFAGGTPYNEYLLGNEAEGLPDYLSSYMQNTPYYKYQDQQLNSIFGGGGYGTPGFTNTGNQQPQPIDETPTTDYESTILTLNERIDALLAQIEGKDSTIAKELTTDQGSTFGSPTPDPKSNLIIQEGDLAGKLDLNSDIFDYLDISPEDKAGIQEYNYIPGYEAYMGSYEGDNLTEQLNSYINQSTADLGGLNTEVTADDTYIPKNSFDPNLGAIVNEMKQADGSYKQYAVIPNKGWVEVGSFTVDAEGNKTYSDKQYANDANITTVENSLNTPLEVEPPEVDPPEVDPPELDTDKDRINLTDAEFFDKYGISKDFDTNNIDIYASGGQILNSIKTLENYTQPLPTGGMQDNLYAVGGEIMQSSDTVEIDGQIIEKSDQVETVLANPIIQEKMPEGDRKLLEQMSYVILGRLTDDGTIVQEFTRLFGEESYAKLKAELIPLPQQEGMIEGEGGGMDDKVNGVIGDQEQVAVSPGEFIVPADVVGNLGDGNSEEGARIMDDFLSRVRSQKHDTEEQPDPINLDNVMPA